MVEEIKNQFRRLNFLRKFELEKLIKIFSGKKLEDIKTKLITYLSDNYSDQVSDFIENLGRMRNVYPYVAREYLMNLIPEKSKEIKELHTKEQLLIFMYENQLLEEIDQVEYYCSFRGKELRNAYTLKTESEIKLNQIGDNLNNFVNEWNKSYNLKITTRHYIDRNNRLVITIFREHNQKTYSQFRFRDSTDVLNKNSENLELKKIKIFPVWPEKMEINKAGHGVYNIIFDFDPFSQTAIMNMFMNIIFGPKSQLTKTEIKSVKEIQTEIKQSITISPKWEEIDRLINDRKTPVIKKIKSDKTLSKNRMDTLTKLVDSIRYAGPSLRDDPKTTTKELTMKVGNIGKFMQVISSAKGFLSEFFSKVSKSTENQYIYINDKSVLLTKGSMKFSARLSEDEKVALKLFLGED